MRPDKTKIRCNTQKLKKVFAVRSLSFVGLYKRDWAMPFVLIYEQSTLLHKVTSAERKKLKKQKGEKL